METEFNAVLVVGAGGIGRQVAGVCALRGFTTHVYDVDADQLLAAEREIQAVQAGLAAKGLLEPELVAQSRARLKYFSEIEQAAQGVGLVSESVPENLAMKREVFALLNKVCAPDTVFTTNTSDLVPSLLAEATGRPGLFAALHFHAPLRGGDVVDIMPHPGTYPETLSRLRHFAESLGQYAVVLEREHPGYVFNNLLNALNRAALELVVEGVATPEVVDQVWTRIMHAPLGPFAILDRVGLDTALRIAKLGVELQGDRGLQRIVDYLDQYVSQGRLGVKSGQGFYAHAAP